MAQLILAGFMASGKSSIGRALARLLHCRFLDLDEEIERRSGKSPAAWIRELGELAFRQLETATLRSLDLDSIGVLALGGGTLLNVQNLQWLNGQGPLVCLKASPQTIVARLQAGEDRPLLSAGQNLHTEIEELLTVRRKSYERIAWQFSTDELSPEAAATLLARELENHHCTGNRQWPPPEPIPGSVPD